MEVTDFIPDKIFHGNVTVMGSLIQSAAARSITPNSSAVAGNTILVGENRVTLAANTTDVNDWFTLPAIADVPVGYVITITAGAANCEMRTPASSNTKINNVDSDGSQEYLVTAGDTVIVRKTGDTTGWVAQSITSLGAVRTAVIPD